MNPRALAEVQTLREEFEEVFDYAGAQMCALAQGGSALALRQCYLLLDEKAANRNVRLSGYERTKADLKRAKRALLFGQLAEADVLIRASGASGMDLMQLLTKKELRQMAEWAKARREASV